MASESDELVLKCPCDSCEYSHEGCELGCSKLLRWYVEVVQRTRDPTVVKVSK